MTPSPAAKRAHQETQRRLLDAERDAQERLAAAARDALAKYPGSSPAALKAGADAAREAVAVVTERLRGEARAAGRSTLAHELRVGAEDSGLRALGRIALGAAGVVTLSDQIAGRRAGASYAAAWLERAAVDGPGTATRMTRHRIATIAGAEYGQAFGVERDATLKRLARSIGPEIAGVVVIAKAWDARLDACPRCRDLDGQVRPIGLDYRGETVPGLVHRRCRCISGVVILPAVTVRDAA